MSRASVNWRTYSRTHFAKAVEKSVEHNEKREDALDWTKGTSDDETEDRPTEEAHGHGLLATDAVHEDTSDNTTREVEAVDNSPESDVLDEGIVGIELANDGRRKDAEWVRDKVVHEPGERSSEHRSPVPLDSKPIWDFVLHSVLAVLCRAARHESAGVWIILCITGILT